MPLTVVLLLLLQLLLLLPHCFSKKEEKFIVFIFLISLSDLVRFCYFFGKNIAHEISKNRTKYGKNIAKIEKNELLLMD